MTEARPTSQGLPRQNRPRKKPVRGTEMAKPPENRELSAQKGVKTLLRSRTRARFSCQTAQTLVQKAVTKRSHPGMSGRL
jgi:hypothetical protein